MTDYTPVIRSISILMARVTVYLTHNTFKENALEKKARLLIASRYETLSAKREITALYAVLWYDLMNDAQHLIGSLTPIDTRIGQTNLYLGIEKMRGELEPIFAPIKQSVGKLAV